MLKSFADDLAESLAVLRDNVPPDGQPYYGCFSGGKDSIVIKHLAKMAGVPVVWHYNVTTIDPPELVKFIKREHPDVIFVRPKHGNFFSRAKKKGFPTRRNRWCCSEYKEGQNPPGVSMIIGIRAQESPARASRWGLVSEHFRTGAPVVCPIYRWEAADLWRFIKDEKIPYCSLYDEGFKRLGCVGCPMGDKRRDFAKWPRFEKKWKDVFRAVWERRSGTTTKDGRPWFGDVYFSSWTEMFEWWISNRSLPDKKTEYSDQGDLWRRTGQKFEG